jgi:hypothetical protein
VHHQLLLLIYECVYVDANLPCFVCTLSLSHLFGHLVHLTVWLDICCEL